MINTYLQEMPEKLASLQKATELGDTVTMYLHAHVLGSGSALL